MTKPADTLPIAADLNLPLDAAAQKLAFLGISGSGKTYGASKLAECLWAAAQQFVVIDTVGNWWGLRLAKDGKRNGIPIPILGGDHGDVELDASHGELAADTVVDSGHSIIIDVSDFTNSEMRQFVVAFATRLLAAKKKKPSPLMVFWEECQDIVPQRVFGEDARMVGAVQKLIKKGRNYGVGTTLISQRAAAVNKEALNQCHTLFGFRLVGKLDRKAAEDWMSDHGNEPPSTPMSKLETGTCVLYSPHWLKENREVTIAPKWTFDASATPDFTQKRGSVAELAPIDLTQFAKTMGAAIEAAKIAKENSPEVLAAKVRELEMKLYEATEKVGVDARANKDLGEARARVAELEGAITSLQDRLAQAHDHASRVDSAHAAESDAIADLMGIVRGDSVTLRAPIAFAPVRQLHPSGPYPMPQVVPTVGKGPGDSQLGPMLRGLLTVLAQQKPGVGLPKGKLLNYAGYASSGQTSKAFAEMNRQGWCEPAAGGLAITAAGRKALGAYTPKPTGDAYYQSLLAGKRLDTMQKAILREIHAAYPRALAKGVVLEKAEYASSGQTSKAFAKLAKLDIIIKAGKSLVRASDDLFDRPSAIH